MATLLDACCCAGGAAVGYARAGFAVTGLDLEEQPNYPFPIYHGDVLAFLAAYGGDFDAIHVSPPCQAYSTATRDHGRHPRLIGPVRALLRKIGKPYVIENVEGARSFMINPIKLCGSSFGLGVRRHRMFETSAAIRSPGCDHRRQGIAVGVYGDHPERIAHRRPYGTGRQRGRKAVDLEEARKAMGISWMTWHELTEAIPPAYTEYIGTKLIMEVDRGRRRSVVS